MELSIIVPIYNVEKYLPKCLDSILAQTFTDFELILIDDGSPDNCGKIIDDYAEKDSRIVVIHQVNKGVSAARNAGLRIAKGKYVGFVDPDDYIHQDMYEKMIESARKSNSEIVCCDFCRINEHGEISHRNLVLQETMDKEEFMTHLFDIPRTIGGSTCNKLFIRERINDFFDENMTVCEDWWFLYKYILKITKASYIGKGLYYIVYRATSATHTIVAKNFVQIDVRRKALEQLKIDLPKVSKAAEADYLDSCMILRGQILEDFDDEDFAAIKKRFCSYYKKYFFSIAFNKLIDYKTKIMYSKYFLKFK